MHHAGLHGRLGAELANRGVADVLIVCCDGLTGFPEAIEATWPPIYQASDAESARVELDDFAKSELGQQNPHTVAAFRNAWERFVPFLAFPPMLRQVIYTTNSIESLNYQLRKIIKNRGHFPSDES